MKSDRPESAFGTRGEIYVLIQGVLFAILLRAPPGLPGSAGWPAPWDAAARYGGGFCLAGGASVIFFAARALGRNLTPLPHPADGNTLIANGPYRWLRHPIYSSILLMALGWALWRNGSLTLLYALLLFVFFAVKARREEAWPMERHPEYAAYREKTRRLIPWLY